MTRSASILILLLSLWCANGFHHPNLVKFKSRLQVASLDTLDAQKLDKLPWKAEGYKNWKWKSHNINFVDLVGVLLAFDSFFLVSH